MIARLNECHCQDRFPHTCGVFKEALDGDDQNERDVLLERFQEARNLGILVDRLVPHARNLTRDACVVLWRAVLRSRPAPSGLSFHFRFRPGNRVCRARFDVNW